MKIVIAVDSFKGSVSASEACRALAEGIRVIREDVEIVERPMADGGEGTAEVMMGVLGGEWQPCEVTGPLPGSRVRAGFAWFPETHIALVEMASASGLVLVNERDRDPMRTTTYGTGELLAAAALHGAEKILLAVGGSATVDGGAGAAAALGWMAVDASGRRLDEGGGALRYLDRLRFSGGPALPPIDVLCDVASPLLGPEGAAVVFGPQKGATADTIPLLERGLERFADCVGKATGKDIRSVAGGGAAGGLAAGAHGLLGARLTRGADTVVQAIGLPDLLSRADWVISGEGRFDGQTSQGKVVSGVLSAAHAAGIRSAVIAGRVEVEAEEVRALGIDAVLQSSPPGMAVEVAMAAGTRLLREAGTTFARLHLGGGSIT